MADRAEEVPPPGRGGGGGDDDATATATATATAAATAAATASSCGDGGGTGPSGYTPLEGPSPAGGGGGVKAGAAAIFLGEADEAGAGAGLGLGAGMATTTFTFASHLPPDAEPEGWSDYDDDDGGDGDGGGGGAFFADMAAFDASSGASAADHGYVPMAIPDGTGGGGGAEVDFRAAADHALRALDEEYAATVGVPKEGAKAAAGGEQEAGGEAAPGEGPGEGGEGGGGGRGQEEEDGAAEEAEPTAVAAAAEGDEMAPPPAKSPLPPREVPAVDGDAVRRAVRSLRLRSPDLASSLDAGAQRRLDPRYRLSAAPGAVPGTHAVIPPAPLAAFRRGTPKAVAATERLCRSATAAEAAVRCLPHLLVRRDAGQGQGTSPSPSPSPPGRTLTVHIVGADHVECGTDAAVRAAVGPFARWIAAAGPDPPTEIAIELLGPNVPDAAEARGGVDLTSPGSSSGGEGQGQGQGQGRSTARARSVNCLYHDYLRERGGGGAPDLVVMFNAGIWGYDEWRPTLEALCEHESPLPVVVTGYTVQEAEDDAEVITDVVNAAYPTEASRRDRCLWEAQVNPYGSRKRRDTATAAEGREYRENGAWQGWLLGGSR